MIKRTLLLFFCLAGCQFSFGQKLVSPTNPNLLFTENPGYVTINELNGAFGLGGTNIPFSSFHAGLTTLHGYQFNSKFTLLGGSGVLFYNGGTVIPLIADFRYFFNNHRYAPYLCANGGFMFNFDEVFMVFADPGVGVRYGINHNLGLTISAGLLVQKDTGRDSFIHLKLGLVYKPEK